MNRESSAPLRTLFKVLAGMNVAGALLVVMLLVLINVDSLGRTFFSNSILGVHEIVELSLVAIVFLQLGDAVRSGRLMRSDGLLTILDQRLPVVARSMRAFFDLVSVAFLVLIVVGGVPRFMESYRNNEFKGTAQLFTVPEWPVKLIIVVGAIAAILAFLVSAWREFRPAGRD
ncbi:MAG: TRAP transporter small permease [Betaproteobacteria bacterium]|nr:TRAP transporter small permease [Betaproteobacteria bacterium]MDH5343158.1 TRAP transporter small permease [Betaproteobacteria bacterium]